MTRSTRSNFKSRTARAVAGVVLVTVLAAGGVLAVAPDADAANSVKANSVKVAPAKANSV